MQTFFDVNRLFLNFGAKTVYNFCDNVLMAYVMWSVSFLHARIYIYIILCMYMFEFVISIDIPQRCARMRICGTCKRSAIASVCVCV